jgi:hypothetical protein
MASLGLTGFTLMFCLRGFDQLMLDLAQAPERIEGLADIVFGFEEALIAEVARFEFDAVAFGDDLGMQSGLIMSPRTLGRYA